MKPRLIFTECHNDPATSEQLRRMLPLLQSQGYVVYSEETPDTSDLLQQKKYIQNKLEDYAILTKLIDDFNSHQENGININHDMRLLSHEERMNQIVTLTLYDHLLSQLLFNHKPCTDVNFNYFINKYTYDEEYQNLINGKALLNLACLDRYESHIAMLDLLNEVAKLNMIYQGIDVDYSIGRGFSNLYASTLNSKRDKKMASAFLDFSRNNVSKIGLAHAQVIEKILLQSLSAEEVNTRYCFITIYSKYTNQDDIKKLSTENHILIDCTDTPNDAIDTVIINSIEQRRAAYTQLLPTLSQKACDDLLECALSLELERSHHHRYGLWTLFKGKEQHHLISTIKKLIDYFSEHTDSEGLSTLSKQELKALNNKKLNKLISHFVLQGLLAPASVQHEQDGDKDYLQLVHTPNM